VLIADQQLNTGIYRWEVPSDINSADVRIKIVGFDEFGNAIEQVTDAFTIDNTAPVITDVHAPANVSVGNAVRVTAKVTDNFKLTAVTLKYRTANLTDYTELPMSETANSRYETVIPAQSKEGTIEYYITATDGANTAATDAACMEISAAAGAADAQVPPEKLTPSGLSPNPALLYGLAAAIGVLAGTAAVVWVGVLRHYRVRRRLRRK
jgi:hypothetical protein